MVNFVNEWINKMFYTPKYFKLKELVNPLLLKRYGEKLWLVFDPNLLCCADLIRDKYGKCTVNANGLIDCGLRDFNSNTGASLSAHKFGRALDLHISAIEVEASKINDALERKQFKINKYNKIRSELIADPRFDCLNFENNVSWLHIDTFMRKYRLFLP